MKIKKAGSRNYAVVVIDGMGQVTVRTFVDRTDAVWYYDKMRQSFNATLLDYDTEDDTYY